MQCSCEWRSIFGKISITSIRATVSDQFGCKFFLAGSQIHFCCVDKGRLSAPFFSTGVIGVSFFGRFRICIIEICRMIDFNFDYNVSDIENVLNIFGENNTIIDDKISIVANLLYELYGLGIENN